MTCRKACARSPSVAPVRSTAAERRILSQAGTAPAALPISNNHKEDDMGGSMDKLKGKLKKAEGEITNDKVRQAQGWVEEKKGEAEQQVEQKSGELKEKFE